MLFLRYYLWIAPHALMAALAFAIFGRQLHRRFPFFFGYVVFEVIEFLILFTMSLAGNLSLPSYQWVLVSGLVVGTLLKCGVLGEASAELLYSQHWLRPMLSSWLRATGASLLLACSLASLALFQSDAQRLERIFRTLDFSLSMVLSGLFLLLLLLARYFHLSLRSYTARILLGFGIYGTVCLATSALRAELPSGAETAIGLTQMAAYHVAVLVWLGYLVARQPSSEPNERRLPELDFEFWNRELERMVGR